MMGEKYNCEQAGNGSYKALRKSGLISSAACGLLVVTLVVDVEPKNFDACWEPMNQWREKVCAKDTEYPYSGNGLLSLRSDRT
jgi:hypothetical protein